MNFSLAIMLSAGALAGAFSRFYLQKIGQAWAPGLPWGTFAANSVGAFIMGLCGPIMITQSPNLRIFLVTGFLGCLTTLSSLNFEVIDLFQQRRYLAGLLHWGGGALLTFVICAVGWALSGKILTR